MNMDYEDILMDIKPTAEEKKHIDDVSSDIMNFFRKHVTARALMPRSHW